ncbi:hypothetical protein D3C80_1053300 [compost metagenome]
MQKVSLELEALETTITMKILLFKNLKKLLLRKHLAMGEVIILQMMRVPMIIMNKNREILQLCIIHGIST